MTDNAIQAVVGCDLSEHFFEEAMNKLEVNFSFFPQSVILYVGQPQLFCACAIADKMNKFKYLRVGVVQKDGFGGYEWVLEDQTSGKTYYSPGA